MSSVLLLRRQWLITLTYGVAAAAALTFTRYDGGVAFLWGANAILIAALVRTSFSRWWAPMLACGLVGMLMTGLLGLGWRASLPFAILNVGEAACAAVILRGGGQPRQTLDSLRWVARYLFGVGIAGPLFASSIAALTLVVLGRFSPEAIFHLFAGHSLGNLTFTALALMFTGRRAREETLTMLRARPKEAAALLTTMPVLFAGVFFQDVAPLLFLPVMAVVLATFRLGRVGAVLALLQLSLIGGLLSAVGYGPVQLLASDDIAARMQFIQFYLAATVLTVLPVSADLHQRNALLRRVRLSEERFRLMMEHSSDLMMHIGNDGTFRYVSPSMRQIGGYDPTALVGRPSAELIEPDHLEHVRHEHWGTMASPGETKRYQYQGVMADGSRRWFETHSRAIIDEDGRSDGVLSIARDITDSRLREQKLTDAAHTDHLTRLPNRRAFETMVQDCALGGRGATSCIVLLDIDHFKQVNDLYGHDVGDDVLTGFSRLLQARLRPGDVCARLGGEEFALLFPGTAPAQAMQITDRLRQEVGSTPIATGAGRIRVTISGGVAPLGSSGLDAALKVADKALYRAKSAGRDQLQLAA